LEKAIARVEALPIPRPVEDAAYERFKQTGELPDAEKLARACIDRALNYGHSVRNGMRVLDIRETLRALDRLGKTPEREPGWQPPRKQLFLEAVYGWEVVRMAARIVIKALVTMGLDPEDPDFVDEDLDLPDWGGVGLHLLGFPECVVKPPYKRQAERLFRRMDELRERVDRDDAGWMEEYGEATLRFLREGELPVDALMADAALAYGEFMGLVAHFLGGGDREVMDAYDLPARGSVAARARAMETLRGMGREGRLLSKMPPASGVGVGA
jgi:hypothetical protein